MTYSYMIVDDEPLAHEVLKKYMERIPSLTWTGSFYNAVDAQLYLDVHKVDLLFLDIQMPEITGVDFLKRLKSKPVTIFTTAYRKYALVGFDLGVIDYLLKPIEFDRFEMAVRRAIDFLESKTEDKNIDLEIKVGTSTVLLDRREIQYARGLKDYTIIYTDKNKYTVLGNLKSYEKTLSPQYFIRVHKSFIIAKNRIKIIRQQKIKVNDVDIPIGRSYRPKLDEYLEEKKQV